LYYCSINCLLSHGLRFPLPSQVPYPPHPPPPGVRVGLLCWPQALKDRSRKTLASFKPLFLSLAGCKNTTFSITSNGFFEKFFISIYIILIINGKNFSYQYFIPKLHTLLYKRP